MIYIETPGMRIIGNYNGKELEAEFDQKYIIPAISKYQSSSEDDVLKCIDLPFKKRGQKWAVLRRSIESI
jgi:hypothetical protein